MSATVTAVCISTQKGTKKHPVRYAELIAGYGIQGDAHAGFMHRQVSLLADESVDKMRDIMPQLKAGDFAENILTRGIELKTLPIGAVLRVGSATLEITQIGKECHADCEIRRITGKCVMPTEGVFAKVLEGGIIAAGDSIEILR